jgi:hypothetical protein
MSEKLETAEGFTNTLAEVELLLREAEDAAPGKLQANEQKFAVMNKSALLLLTGKFEAFLEGAAEDFLFAVNQVGAKARHLPIRILAEHSVHAVREIEKKLNNGDIEAVRSVFVALGRYWIDLDACADLNVSCKFNYGKHGEDQAVRLFQRMGIKDVFAEISIVDDAAEVYDGDAAPPMDVKGTVNSLTGIRNNILHQDETPNLTTASLRKQSIVLQRFATALVAELQATLDEIERKVKAEGVA